MLIVLLVMCTATHAQNSHIHRCIGESGEPTFSDQKCSALKTAAAPAPPANSANQAGDNSTAPTQLPTPAIPQTCAASANDLRNRVASSFSAGNAVGFSGLFLWDGFGQGSAIAPLRDLATLVREPLISIDLDSALPLREPDRYRRRDERDEGYVVHELTIRTVGEQDRNVPFESVRHYEMREQAGCWWLLIPW